MTPGKPSTSLDLRLNRRSTVPQSASRSVRLSQVAAMKPTPATKTAEMMVAACRENVRFLNRHLEPLTRYFALPPVIDNVLYLAYTLTLTDTAPFDILTFRRRLADHGIETASSFSFTTDPEALCCGPALDRMEPQPRKSGRPIKQVCLPCHHYLSILDLQQIITAIESCCAQFGEGQTNGVGRQTTLGRNG